MPIFNMVMVSIQSSLICCLTLLNKSTNFTQAKNVHELLTALIQCDIVVYDISSFEPEVEDCLLACNGECFRVFLCDTFITLQNKEEVCTYFSGSLRSENLIGVLEQPVIKAAKILFTLFGPISQAVIKRFLNNFIVINSAY